MITLLIFLQNHDPTVAETAAVGYPHELYGEGMPWPGSRHLSQLDMYLYNCMQ